MVQNEFLFVKIFQEPTTTIHILLPIRQANLLPAMQDGAIILQAS